MRKTGAELAVYALEQVGVRYTFGIPGVHNTELYDELNKSERIQPVLVTHELGAAFMADGVSRMGDSVGTLMIVPAAGTTHAMSGIGEAFLDGIPMLVISGGTRRDSGRHYQLHQLDQTKLVQAITKKAWVITRHEDIIPTIYEAYDLAVSGTPGPVFVEIPAEFQLFQGEVSHLPAYQSRVTCPKANPEAIQKAAQLLRSASKPGLYVGWGARDATDLLIPLAELLEAPVSTTMQGLSVFPADHPLHTGMGFGPSAVPAAEKAFEGCDCLLTIGARFGELATGSFNLPVPANHIHIDINSEVFNKNYPATIAIESDGREATRALLDALRHSGWKSPRDGRALRGQIRADKAAYLEEWTRDENRERVGPGRFFRGLRAKLPPDAYVVVDDGNHTFLTAEQFPVYRSKHLASPTDFNAMGYAVPAAIGAKLANPGNTVVGIVGDGAFLMTGLEILTASTLNLGVVFFVFYDGELGQISQFQKIPLNRKTCTVMGDIRLDGIARATGAAYFEMRNDVEIDSVLTQALSVAAQGRPVVVDVKIDYTKKTRFTQGVVKANLSRFPMGEKVRFIGRAIKRHILG